MKITLNQLKKKKQCNKYEIFDSFADLNSNINYEIGSRIKDFIKKQLLVNDLSANGFNLPEDLFENDFERKIYEDKCVKYILRFMFFIQMAQLHDFRINFTDTVHFNSHEILASADIIALNKDNIPTAINIKYSKPFFNFNARLTEKKPYNSYEIFFLGKLAHNYYPSNNSRTSGMIFYLKNNKDVKDVISDFDLKQVVEIKRDYVNGSTDDDEYFKELIEQTLAGTDKQRKCNDCSYNFICSFANRAELTEIKEEEEEEKTKGKGKKDNIRLNDEQLSICQFKKGIARVSAGPGSGKTATIVERFTNLYMCDIPLSDICMITFTNAAAEEMKDRVVNSFNQNFLEIDKEDLNIMTINSLGQLIIEEFYHEFLFTEKPILIDKVVKYDILYKILLELYAKVNDFSYPELVKDRLMKDFALNTAFMFSYNFTGAVGTMEKIISTMKKEKLYNKNDILNSYKATLGAKEYTAIKEIYNFIYNKYVNYCLKNNLIDFDDQLYLVLKALIDKKAFMKNIQFKHLVVDEFQDVNEEQVLFIKLLCDFENFQSLMVVGDPAQAIYAFRGTSPVSIIEFHKIFNNVKDFNLLNNYRSTGNIVQFSDLINNNNSEGVKRKCETKNVQGLPVVFHVIPSKNFEATIAKQIESTCDKEKLNNICVIARTKAELSKMALELDKVNLPYIYDFNEPVFLNKYLEPICDFAKSLYDKETKQGLMKYLGALNQIDDTFDKTMIEANVILLRKEINEQIENRKQELKLEETTDEIFKELFEYYIKEIPDENLISYLLEKLEEYDSFLKYIEFLDKSILYQNDEIITLNNQEKINAVKLTTAHSSKGKEWDTVYVLTNKFKLYKPSKNVKMSKKEILQNDEERRLFYVAATRAEKNLYIYSCNHSQLTHEIEEALKAM